MEGGGAGGGDSSDHRLVGARVAKEYDSCIFMGYVTAHFPASVDESTGQVDEELFHIEFDDGNEEDMDVTEVAVAQQLAQEHESATA